jgi:hypothetical protein
MGETKEAQEKGGVEIAVASAAYKAVRADTVTVRQEPPPSNLATFVVGAGGRPGQVYIVERSTPHLVAEPKRLEFTVRINNKLPRVFRGQGSVVQFNVDGKLIPFGDTDYTAFINGIVPPRNEFQLKIYGPALDQLHDKGTIGIFLYDVVTATDTAGSVTEKQNFEWYFNYTTQLVQESAEPKVTERWVDVEEYQQQLMRLQQDQLQPRLQQMRQQLPQTRPPGQ